MNVIEYVLVILVFLFMSFKVMTGKRSDVKENKNNDMHGVFDAWMDTHDCDWIEFELMCMSDR